MNASGAITVDYPYLRRIVYAHTRNVLEPSRDYVFEARLAKLVRSKGMASLSELVQHMRAQGDAQLEAAVAEEMTINETSFFRDARLFELLRTRILPELIEARRSARVLRLWSAACSTGQEGYSLAILLRDSFPQLADWKIQILGTDVSEQVVRRAEGGRYLGIEVNRGLPARMLVRYFEQLESEWIVRADVRALCRFKTANLCTVPLPFHERFDLILLRNVMLYFDQEWRRSVLAEIHRLLAPDGVLILGATEQPADGSQWTAVLDAGTCYYRRREQEGTSVRS